MTLLHERYQLTGNDSQVLWIGVEGGRLVRLRRTTEPNVYHTIYDSIQLWAKIKGLSPEEDDRWEPNWVEDTEGGSQQ